MFSTKTPIVLNGTSFDLTVNYSNDVFLIFDIYSLKGNVEEHFCWFSYDFAVHSWSDKDENILLSVPTQNLEEYFTNQILNVETLLFRDSWYSSTFTSLPDEFEVRCVLRSKKDNSILKIFTVYIVSDKTIDKYKNYYVNHEESILFHQYPIASKSKLAIVSAQISKNDAMTNHAIRLSKLWQAHGGSCDHIAINYKPEDLFQCKPYFGLEQLNEYSLIIFDFGSFTPGIEDMILNTDNIKKIIYFHGITPPKHSLIFATQISFSCKRGIDQLKRIIKLSLDRKDISWGFNSPSTKIQFNELLEEVQQESGVSDLSKASVDSNNGNINNLLNDSVILQPLFDSKSVSSINYQENRERDASKLQLLCLGRLVPHKKCEYAIDLASALIQVGFQVKLHFVFSSTISDYQKYIENVSRKYLPNESAYFHKQLPHHELTKLWLSTSYCVHPSEHEGFGIVVRESIANNVPVISSSIASVQDEGLSSVIYSEYNSSHILATAQLIKNISTNDSLKRELDSRIKSDQKLIADNVLNSRTNWINYLQRCQQSQFSLK